MTADREVLRTRLIEAMLGEYGQGNSIGEDVERMLDAALALCSPCQTCGGVGDFDGGYSFDSCLDCNGSGVSSVPVVVEYLMAPQFAENVHVWEPQCDDPPSCRPVWVYKENRDQ